MNTDLIKIYMFLTVMVISTILIIINIHKKDYCDLIKTAVSIELGGYIFADIMDFCNILIELSRVRLYYNYRFRLGYQFFIILATDIILTFTFILFLVNISKNNRMKNAVIIANVIGIIAEIVVFALKLTDLINMDGLYFTYYMIKMRQEYIILILLCISTIIMLAALIILVYNSEFMDKQTYEIQKFNYVKEQLYQLKQMADANQIPQDIYELRKNQLLNSIM